MCAAKIFAVAKFTVFLRQVDSLSLHYQKFSKIAKNLCEKDYNILSI